MTRLDEFIVRMQAQRACIDDAAARTAGRPGPVLELGLGNGRTAVVAVSGLTRGTTLPAEYRYEVDLR